MTPRRLVVVNRACRYCGGFHLHRVFVDRRPGPVVTYAACPETKNILTITIQEMEP